MNRAGTVTFLSTRQLDQQSFELYSSRPVVLSVVPCPLEPASNANFQAPPAESESLGVGVSGSLCFQKTPGAFDAAQAEKHSLVNASFLACTFWGLCLGLCVTGLLHG